MKKCFVLLLLASAFSFSHGQSLELKKGAVLNFAVSDLKNVYDLFITIAEIDTAHFVFDWKMSSGNQSKKGSAEITSASLDSATYLLFDIEKIKKFSIPNIAIFLSRQQFQKLKGGKCFISSDASMQGIRIGTSSTALDEVMINGKPARIQQVFGSGEINAGKIWVLDNSTFPLVVGYQGPSLTYTLMNVTTPE